MTPSRSASRTTAGIVIPVASALAAGLFLVMIWMHAGRPVWLGMDKYERLAAAGAAVLAAIAVEWAVLRQFKLVGGGQITEAVVDDVREIPWSPETATADYHFFTQDGRVITARCAIPSTEKEFWQRGRKVTAIYDPARPARHAIDDRLWGVQWQIREAA